MNKTLLSAMYITLCVGSLSASETSEVRWSGLFGGTMTSGDQSTAITIADNGNVLWFNTANTNVSTEGVFYNDEEIFSNDIKTNNIALLCTDAAGELLWHAYSTTTDAVSGQGGVAVDTKGDIIISAKVRPTAGHSVNLIAADNSTTTIGSVPEKPYYQVLVAKFGADGTLKWTKVFDQSTAPAPMASGNNATFTADAVNLGGLAVDNNDNIYVGGYYRSVMTIDGVSLAPQNVTNWSGDTQTTCGNMFIVKLDSNGKYVASATGNGEIGGVSMVQGLEWNDGKLYFCGYARGNSEFTFAGKVIEPAEIISPIVGCLNPDLKADWIKCCPGESVDGKSALQNVGLSIYGNNFWYAGQYNLKITDTDSDKFVASTQGSLREGFVIKFDKTTGEWVASADSRVDYPEIQKLSGYFKAFQTEKQPDVAYVYGYAMDAKIGIFLRAYNAETLQPIDSWNLATGGGTPSCVASAYNAVSNTLYITGRGNKAFTLMGNPEITTADTKSWDVLMAAFSMPAGVSRIDGIVNTGDRDSEIFDLTGRSVGRTADGLRPGIYISNNKKFIVR